MSGKLQNKKLFLLDMDGTIYLDGDLFPGTLPFLEKVKEKGGRCLYLTNNSSKNAKKYIEKLILLKMEKRKFSIRKNKTFWIIRLDLI